MKREWLDRLIGTLKYIEIKLACPDSFLLHTIIDLRTVGKKAAQETLNIFHLVVDLLVDAWNWYEKLNQETIADEHLALIYHQLGKWIDIFEREQKGEIKWTE